MIDTMVVAQTGATATETPPAQAGEQVCVMLPPNYLRDGTARGVIALHGRGADAFQPRVNTLSFGRTIKSLTDVGHCVGSTDAGAANSGTAWSSNLAGYQALDAVTALYNRLTRIGGTPTGWGAKAGKIGLIGWSMGGLTALNWCQRNPEKVSFLLLWAPASDLDYFHGNATYTAEVDAAYGGNYAVNSVGYNPLAPGFLSGMGDIPVRIYHGDADTVVPPQQTLDLINAWPAPSVSTVVHERILLAGKDHTSLFSGVTDDDIQEWARKAAWN